MLHSVSSFFQITYLPAGWVSLRNKAVVNRRQTKNRRNFDLAVATLGKVLNMCGQFLGGSLTSLIHGARSVWTVHGGLDRVDTSAKSLFLHYTI